METPESEQMANDESPLKTYCDSPVSSSEHGNTRTSASVKLEGDPKDSKPGAKPAAGSKPYIVRTPTDQDVLFGRGRPYQSHPGNVNLHRLVTLHKDRYESSQRFDKLAIADQIVYEVKSGGGRKLPGKFLRRVEGEDYWEEAPDDVSREKVAHALRGQIKQARDKQKKKSSAQTPAPTPSNTAYSSAAASLASSHFSSESMSTKQHAMSPSESSAPQSISNMMPPISHPLSALLQHRGNVEAVRQALSASNASNLPSDPLIVMLTTQLRHHQPQLPQQSNIGALQLALAANSQSSDVSTDTLLGMLAAQQQERQQQERLLLLHLLSQSNERNALSSLLGGNFGAQNLLSREQMTVENAVAVLQQDVASRNNAALFSSSLLSTRAGGTAGFDLSQAGLNARQLENVQIHEAIQRFLRHQQELSRENKTGNSRNNPPS